MRNLRVLCLGLIFLILSQSASASAEPMMEGTVQLVEVQPGYPDAVAPGKLFFACASRLVQLRSFFRSQGLPFEENLVRETGSAYCHIHYKPTIPGFRADALNQPITQLHSEVEMLSFLALRGGGYGDSLDIQRAIIRHLPRPIPVRLGVAMLHEKERYQYAVEKHFLDSAELVTLRDAAGPDCNPWVQDYFKSGKQEGRTRMLVTRHLYEGVRENGKRLDPFLDKLRGEDSVRSNLSWEGGDIKFVLHPFNQKQLVVFHGSSARQYLGDLTAQEYGYVLKLEFGADQAVDLSGVSPHIDYFVSFLPADQTVLVGEPMTGSLSLALDALAILKAKFGNLPPELARVEHLLHSSERPDKSQLKSALEKAKGVAKNWHFPQNARFMQRLNSFFLLNCTGLKEADCVQDGTLSVSVQKQLLDEQPALIREWTGTALSVRTTQRLISCCLSIIESQLVKPPNSTRRDKVAENVRKLQQLGFKIVRTPLVAGGAELNLAWAGISYTNGLLIDDVLLLPVFGLNSVERPMLERLENELSPRLRVVPVYARHMMLHNGGIHCIVGTVR